MVPLGNTYVVPGEGRRFLDWQTVCPAPWSEDVNYFLTGALTVEDRRKHEVELPSTRFGPPWASAPRPSTRLGSPTAGTSCTA
ncbi:MULTISPECIES: DUF1679 domain-containing protein [Protofrankia]|uniref:DUF1679 domain-containing protein n=1 Tax=Protofrankia TaxID=2994361 RepID=UPI000A6EBDC3|nr:MULTISPECIES: DUF1679 domain-containing protein [Protofrankia]